FHRTHGLGGDDGGRSADLSAADLVPRPRAVAARRRVDVGLRSGGGGGRPRLGGERGDRHRVVPSTVSGGRTAGRRGPESASGGLAATDHAVAGAARDGARTEGGGHRLRGPWPGAQPAASV